MEEGFNYPAGTALAANPPWSGVGGLPVSIMAGSLTLSNLQPTVPSDNHLRLSGGSLSAYRNFSSSPIPGTTGTSVYFSALINCVVAPTNRQFVASLLPSGSTSGSSDNAPLGLFVSTNSGGCRLSVTCSGSDPATASTVLPMGETHFLVVKYTFTNILTTNFGIASLYVDPLPGDPEPVSPSARTRAGGDDGSSGVAPDLQVVLFRSPSTSSQAIVDFDTVRVGTNWADVTPLSIAVALAGPQNLSICSGEPAVFSVSATGLPPFTYQWRTNGTPIANATNSTCVLPAPTSADAASAYDVVVSGAFETVTSAPASLSISYHAPAVSVPPASQMIVPGITNATFTVSVSGDAPFAFQWRTNGVAIPGATNVSYTITNAGPADTSNLMDVVVSNPCGVVTSSPPATVYFPTLFWAVSDAGAGFFSGENVIFTNTSGIAYYVWSSPDPTVSITNWNLEGQLTELPLGTTGSSRYGFNLNPAASPEYYIFAQTNTGPYTPSESVTIITTPDFVTFYISNQLVPITPGGYLQFPAPPAITQEPVDTTVLAGQTASLSVAATGGGLGYQWFFSNNPLSGVSSATLALTNVTALNAGSYSVIVTNDLGSATSSPAILTVASPPALAVTPPATGAIQLNSTTVTGLTYVVLVATNLSNPLWLPVLTNNSGASGVINFQTTPAAGPAQFYKLVFP